MTRATLSEVLRPALAGGYAVAGLVVLGWEDGRAFVQAAEAEGAPVILQAGPGCRAYTPLPVLAAMFRHLAEHACVPVVTHLDHGESLEVCAQAVALGFSSVMYDGSALPLAKNIAATRAIVQMAHAAGVSVEAELGYVGYADGAESRGTDPAQVAQFARETGVDALAIAVGNTHLMPSPGAQIDRALLSAIRAAAPDLPLVLHGGSGIAATERRDLARGQISKFNIGTELRQCFGTALRDSLARDPARFDRIAILSETIPPLVSAARAVIAGLRN